MINHSFLHFAVFASPLFPGAALKYKSKILKCCNPIILNSSGLVKWISEHDLNVRKPRIHRAPAASPVDANFKIILLQLLAFQCVGFQSLNIMKTSILWSQFKFFFQKEIFRRIYFRYG